MPTSPAAARSAPTAIPSQESTSVTDTGTALDRAFVQFGPLTAGRITSFYDFYANDLAFSAQLGSDRVTQILAYTATLGNGFSATLAMEDPVERRVFGSPFQPNVFDLLASEPLPDLPDPGHRRPPGGSSCRSAA